MAGRRAASPSLAGCRACRSPGGSSDRATRRSSSPRCPATTTARWTGRWPSSTPPRPRVPHAIKLQTYTADTITIDVDRPAFRHRRRARAVGRAEPLPASTSEAHTPWEWHEPIFARARERGLLPFSSPFDASAVELLEGLDCRAVQGRLGRAGRPAADPADRGAPGKPMVMSTGMATLAEIDAAVTRRPRRRVPGAGAAGLHRVLPGPAGGHRPAARIPALAEAFDVPVGLSDHTRGIGVSVAAVALGANVIEKHVTLDRADGGVDSDFSLEPAELAALAREPTPPGGRSGRPGSGRRRVRAGHAAPCAARSTWSPTSRPATG